MELQAFTEQEIKLHEQRLFIACNKWLLSKVIDEREADINSMYDKGMYSYSVDETGVCLNRSISIEALAIQIVERREALERYIKRCNELASITFKLIATYDKHDQHDIESYIKTCGKCNKTEAVKDFLRKSAERKERDYVQQENQKEADKSHLRKVIEQRLKNK